MASTVSLAVSVASVFLHQSNGTQLTDIKSSNELCVVEMVCDWNYHFLDPFAYNVRTLAGLLWRECRIAMTVVRERI